MGGAGAVHSLVELRRALGGDDDADRAVFLVPGGALVDVDRMVPEEGKRAQHWSASGWVGSGRVREGASEGVRERVRE